MDRVGTERTLADELGALRDLDAAALRHRARALTGRSLAAHLPRPIALRLLAYRLQAEAFGDLDARTARVLDRIAPTAGAGRRRRQGDA